jgi:peptidoglycan hydrolase-like protein with peptidoglycan-binding domain
MKKIILSETQAKRLIDNMINEQDDNLNINKAIQCFLNKKYKAILKIDGYIGEQTKRLIEKLQTEKNLYPVDGVWGQQTVSSLNKNELDVFKQCVADTGDVFDKVGRFLGL